MQSTAKESKRYRAKRHAGPKTPKTVRGPEPENSYNGVYIYSYICIHAHVSCIFMDVSIASAASPAHTHPSRKESTKGGAARSAAPFLDGCVWAGEAADAMETSINMHETCACMHI